MFELFRNKISKRWKNKDDFMQEFLNIPHHKWIKNDRYIKANFEEFFSFVPMTDIYKLFGKQDIWFIPSEGRFSCAIESIANPVILVFPECMQLLRSFSPASAKAILSHELGHIYHGHSKKNIDVMDAQVEADSFSIKLGFADELESFLNDQPESIEKRVRLTYLTGSVLADF